MLSIFGIKKTIKQHTADMDITDSVDYKISLRLDFIISQPRLLYNPYRPNAVIYYFRLHVICLPLLVPFIFIKKKILI
jgi:hypothetical protein